MQVQSTVAGENYDVRIGTGDTCETGNFDSDRCLVLETLDEAAQAKVPLNVSTDFSIHEEGSGVLQLTVDGDGSRSGTAAVVDRQLRIGVGEDFEGNRYGEVVGGTNKAPVAKIDFSPGVPRSSDPIQFTAVDSFDPDGRIDTYEWDLDNDGIYEVVGKGPNVSKDLSPGRHRVRLRVRDNAPLDKRENDTVIADIRVSGLAYNRDLDDSDVGPSGAVSFSVTNEWAETISITQVMIRPKVAESEYPIELDNDCNAGGCPYADFEDGEVAVDGSTGVESGEADRDPDDDGRTEVPSDGVIVELEDPVTVFSGERARIWAGAFLGPAYSDLSGTEFEVGVRYEIELPTGSVNPHNSTVFTDVVGGPNIEEFRIETGRGLSGDQVDAVVVSDKRLDDMRVELGAGLSGTVDNTGTATKLPSGNWEHRVYLGDLESGVVKANLTVARNDSVSAFQTRGPKSINRTAAVLSGEYVWTNESDWNAALDQEGVVHPAYGTNLPDRVRIGYSDSGPGLVGYWPFDGSANDVAGSLDGTPEGVGTARGVYGSSSYTFRGDDYVEIGPQFGNIHTSTSSLSMWVKTSTRGDWYLDDAPGLTGYVDGYFQGLVWGWLDGEERLNVGSDYDGARSSDTIDDGQWHHVVMTYEENSGDDDVEVYIDGQRRSGEVGGDNNGDFSDIGRVVDGGYFNGRIDEVRSYDRVLDQSDVDELSDGRGSMTTGWKNGTDSFDLSNLALQYSADVPYSTDINVTVEVVADDGTRLESEQIELDDGQDSVSVDGLGTGSASSYRLDIEFATDSPLKTPTLYQIGVAEES